MNFTKKYLIQWYKKELSENLYTLPTFNVLSENKKSEKINTTISSLRNSKIEELKTYFLNKSDFLNNLLMIHYTSYVVMLEERNNYRKYGAMDFPRRIGELWEPFCRLVFENSVSNITNVSPKSFEFLKNNATEQLKFLSTFIPIDNSKIDKYKEALTFTTNFINIFDSMAIQLKLDLHIKCDYITYNIDFKSGFNSNEKGNTNRLLMVGEIYSTFFKNNKCLLLCRTEEEGNNHYLQTIKNSNQWDVFCGIDAYNEIERLTLFPIKKWIDENIDWTNDISIEFYNHLLANNLLDYLNW